MAKKIYFSPSDQTKNTYAVGNTNEAAECRQIALYAVEAATRCGFEAKANVTAGGDAGMETRVKESNAWGADLHIPIHTNAFNGEVMGTRLFVYSKDGEGYQAATDVMAALAPITPGESDSITVKHFYEVHAADSPTVYVEVGFHDSKTEAQWIIDHKQEIAEAIVKGCCNHFGVKYIAPAEEAEEQPEPVSTNTLYRVQVGAFAVKANAERMRDELKGKGYSAFIVEVQK